MDSAFDKLRANYPSLLSNELGPIYLECHEGWYEILNAALAIYAKVEEELGPVRIGQIKEKFGGLRIYAKTPAAFEHSSLMSELLEAWSLQTCELCGQPGKRQSGMGWVATRCEEHSGVRRGFEYQIPEHPAPGIPNFGLKVVRVESSNDAILLTTYHTPPLLTPDVLIQGYDLFDPFDRVECTAEEARERLIELGDNPKVTWVCGDIGIHQRIFRRQ